MITQIHLQLRDRFGILYWFHQKGDGLPLHKHTPELDHDVMCTSGKLRVTIEQHNGVIRHEDLLPGMYLALPVEPHSITALVDGSSFIYSNRRTQMKAPDVIIKLDQPVTFVFDPETIATILDALANHGPFRAVQPVVQNILAQVQASQAKPLVQPPANGPVPPQPSGDSIQ
jgi:hypothetical protein